jgi:hypothetical protein
MQNVDFRIRFDDQLWTNLKVAYAARLVPAHAYGYAALNPARAPRAGDLVLAKVKSLGYPNRLDDGHGRSMLLVEGDVVIGVYGNYYATNSYEGLVPHTTNVCQLLDQTGICGVVLSKHVASGVPAELFVLGYVFGPNDRLLNLGDFGLTASTAPVPAATSQRTAPPIIAVVGSSKGSGTTVAGTSLVQGLSRSGYRVAVAKLTGSASGSDRWSYRDHGASAVLDFSDCGVPGTYLCTEEDLLGIYRTLYYALRRHQPDIIVIEFADGLVQRETKLLLEHPEVCASIDGVLYVAVDSIAADGGVRWLATRAYTVLGVSGLVSASPLGAKEAEDQSKVRCYSREELMYGALNPFLDRAPRAMEQHA